MSAPQLSPDVYAAYHASHGVIAHRFEVALTAVDVRRLNQLAEAIIPATYGTEVDGRLVRAVDPLSVLLNQLGIDPGPVRAETRVLATDADMTPPAERTAA